MHILQLTIPGLILCWLCQLHATIPEKYLCSDEQILSLLSSLNTRKATGADGITAQMLKATSTSIAKSSYHQIIQPIFKDRYIPYWLEVCKSRCNPQVRKPGKSFQPQTNITIIRTYWKKMYTIFFINTLVTTVHYQEALDNGGEVCAVFLTSAKPLTQLHINHLCTNYSISK